MSQSPVKRAELRRLAEGRISATKLYGGGMGVGCIRFVSVDDRDLLALLDALDEATARAEKAEAALRRLGHQGDNPNMPDAAKVLAKKADWCGACHRGWGWVDSVEMRTALAAEHDTKEDGDG